MAKSLWLASQPLLLASASGTRRQALAQIGLLADVQSSHINERALEAAHAHLSSAEAALLLARAKAQAVNHDQPHRFVLGADQILDCQGRRFAKAADRAQLRQQLLWLSGKTHCLHVGMSLWHQGREIWSAGDQASLTMRALSQTYVDLYLAQVGEEVLHAVGGYHIEGLGLHLFDHIEGAQSCILGLSLLPLLKGLRHCALVAG